MYHNSILPSYKKCKKEADQIKERLFKEQVKNFYVFIKKHLKDQYGNYIHVYKPFFSTKGDEASLVVSVNSDQNEFLIIINEYGISLEDHYDENHRRRPVKRKRNFLKNLREFIASYAAAPE